MRQVLFYIPLKSLSDSLPDIPIYGYGAMLFVAFLATLWLAGRLAERQGVAAKETVHDLAIWIFVSGIIGARITFMIQYRDSFLSFWQFFAIWDGGLVFYGSAFGGVVGFLLAYVVFLRKHKVPAWKMVDIIAPCAALGLCLGRMGCLLNGCCYGNVACPDYPQVTFPLASPPRLEMVKRGYQTVAGFTMFADRQDRRTVAAVDPKSPAGQAGLQAGDVVIKVNDATITQIDDLRQYLDRQPEKSGQKPVQIIVRREGKDVDLAVFFWTGAGFTLVDCTVGKVEPNSPAAAQGLTEGDILVEVNQHSLLTYSDLVTILSGEWPRGLNDLRLTVVRAGSTQRLALPAFTPRTIGLHPTQVYETISMVLLLGLLLAFFPYRGRPGMVMVLFMFCYALHRFLNELLRTDTQKVAFDMTLSQNLSLLVVVCGLLLAGLIWLRPAPAAAPPP